MEDKTKNTLANIGNTGLGMLYNQFTQQQQMNNQETLMDWQQENQMELNQQGAELQYDMWKKTNYGPQVEQMRKAGLNPALMYGMKGGGGTTTGSQSGGSAQGGQAPMAKMMDINQAQKLKAETELINAQKNKLDADTKGSDIKNEISFDTKEFEKNRIKNESLTAMGDRIIKDAESNIARETEEDKKKIIRQQAIGEALYNELTASKIFLTDEQLKGVTEGIKQGWADLNIKEADVEIKKLLGQQNIELRQQEIYIKAALNVAKSLGTKGK